MPRGLSQERAQRIWDAAFGSAYVLERGRLLATGEIDVDSPDFPTLVANAARLRATEAVEALREHLRRERKRR